MEAVKLKNFFYVLKLRKVVGVGGNPVWKVHQWLQNVEVKVLEMGGYRLIMVVTESSRRNDRVRHFVIFNRLKKYGSLDDMYSASTQTSSVLLHNCHFIYIHVPIRIIIIYK
jgi:hypothetical protein